MTKPPDDIAVDAAFDGHEPFPSISVAETVEKLIDKRGIQEAAAHATTVARMARVMSEPEVAADWDGVYRGELHVNLPTYGATGPREVRRGFTDYLPYRS